MLSLIFFWQYICNINILRFFTVPFFCASYEPHPTAGYGVCKFGADFGFQNHPNVEIVAVSDLFPDRCSQLAKVCGCSKTYPPLRSLSETIKLRQFLLLLMLPVMRSTPSKRLSTASMWLQPYPNHKHNIVVLFIKVSIVFGLLPIEP